MTKVICSIGVFLGIKEVTFSVWNVERIRSGAFDVISELLIGGLTFSINGCVFIPPNDYVFIVTRPLGDEYDPNTRRHIAPPENRIDVLNVNILRECGVADYVIAMDEATYFVHRVGPVIEAQVVLSEYEAFHQDTSIHRSPVPSSHRWLQSSNPVRTGGCNRSSYFAQGVAKISLPKIGVVARPNDLIRALLGRFGRKKRPAMEPGSTELGRTLGLTYRH